MIFLDTTIWVSAIDTSDQRHLDGRSVLEALLSGELPSRLTIDHVLDETLTVLKRRGLNPGKTMQTVDDSPLSEGRGNLHRRRLSTYHEKIRDEDDLLTRHGLRYDPGD
ncbi:MAG: hypothetical protein QXG97_06350 [Nitrososphaerota archaeon]